MVTSKRMSAEEKRKVIMGIYHETGQVYIEKEVLALAIKAGVSGSAVADVHQALVDEGLICKEKIGGSNYFWAFAGIKEWRAVTRHDQTLRGIDEINEKIEQTKMKLVQARMERQETDVVMSETKADADADAMCDDKNTMAGDRSKENTKSSGDKQQPPQRDAANGPTTAATATRSGRLAELGEIKKQKETLLKEIEVMAENDPAALADLEEQLKITTNAAHRWTDNIFECKSYMVKKRGVDKKEACKMIGITSAFDYPSSA